MIASDSTLVILDVRTPAEFNGSLGHLAHARLILVQDLENRWKELEVDRTHTMLVYCRTGHRSTAA